MALPHATAAWQPGWPGQPWTTPGVQVGADPTTVALTMVIEDGDTKNIPGALWSRTLTTPAPGLAWCIKASMWWSAVKGTVPTLWLRPDIWPADHIDPPMPEVDLVEGLWTPDQVGFFSKAPAGVTHDDRVAFWEARAGQWHDFEFKLTQDRVFGAWINGAKLAGGPMWWPAGGYRLVVGMWAARGPTFAWLPEQYRLARDEDTDAHQWLRATRVWECAA